MSKRNGSKKERGKANKRCDSVEDCIGKGIGFLNGKDYPRAIAQFKNAAELEKDSEYISCLLGASLLSFAEIKQDEKLFVESCGKYEEAARLSPQTDFIFRLWGDALYALAVFKRDEKLFHQAFEKYAESIGLNPKNVDAFFNWGCALRDLGEIKEDGKLLHESIEKFVEVFRLNPQADNLLKEWSCAVYLLCKLGGNKKACLEAFENFADAMQLNIGPYYRVFANVYALLNNKDKALPYLEKYLNSGNVDINTILNEAFWKPYLEDKDFVELIDRVKRAKDASQSKLR